MDKMYSILLDEVLDSFKDGQWRTGEQLFYKAPKGFSGAIELLVKDGYLEQSQNHYKITFKGQAFVDDGGFVR